MLQLEIDEIKGATMEKTNYTIGKHGNNTAVLKAEKIEANGFRDNESALKAIHVLEGSVKEDFYTQSNGIVYKNKVIHVTEEEKLCLA